MPSSLFCPTTQITYTTPRARDQSHAPRHEQWTHLEIHAGPPPGASTSGHQQSVLRRLVRDNSCGLLCANLSTRSSLKRIPWSTVSSVDIYFTFLSCHCVPPLGHIMIHRKNIDLPANRQLEPEGNPHLCAMFVYAMYCAAQQRMCILYRHAHVMFS